MHNTLRTWKKWQTMSKNAWLKLVSPVNFFSALEELAGMAFFKTKKRFKEFLQFSEERKKECDWTSGIENVKNPHFQALVDMWGVPRTFERHYTEDYNLVSGTRNDTDRTCWKNK